MTLHLILESAEPLPQGTPLTVQIRDTSLADAAAIVLHRTDMTVSDASAPLSLEIVVDDVPRGATVWVHADVDGDGLVSPGDYITMESYPADAGGDGAIVIRLRRV